jgi:plasmid stabilization system protein ParE
VKQPVVSIHPSALLETEFAIDWYRQRSPRAAQRFLDEIDRLVNRIADHPTQFPSYEAGTRRAFLRRFPYFLVFREIQGETQIVAIAHGRRRPGYWKKRVED